MEIKYNTGDRVRATVDCDHDATGYYKGAVGTVTERCTAPAVSWDNSAVVRGVSYKGYKNCRAILQDKLELIKPEPIGVVAWVRPQCDNNIVNSAVRVLAKVSTYILNVVKKVVK